MILHEITVSGFRGLADELHVGPFRSNINIIHAPNGTGKTTLLDGFYHAMLESQGVSGQKAETMMRSAGRDLVPTVEVVFETAGVRYRLLKRFLQRPEAKLSREENGQFTALCEGDAVTAFTRNLLYAKAPERGPMKRDEHYGLGSILWAPQGDIELDGVSGELLGIARGRLGGAAAASGAGDVAVAALVKQWFTRFYTEKNHESKAAGSADIPGLRKQLETAEARFAATQTTLRELDDLRARFDDTASDKARFTQMAAALDAEVGTERETVKRYETAAQAAAVAEAACTAAEERYSAAHEAANAIARARLAKEAAVRKEGAQAAERDRAAANEAAARERLAREQAAGSAAAATLEAAEREAAVAQDAGAFIAARRGAEVARRRLAECEQLEHDIEAARTERGALSAPSAAEMRGLRKAGTATDSLRTALDAAVLHVVFTPAGMHPVQIIAGTATPSPRASADSPIEVSGSPLVEFCIDGVGTIRAHGPATSAETLRAELEAAEAKFAKLAQPFGTRDLAELELRAETAARLNAKIENLEARLADRTADSGSVGDLREKIAGEEALLARLAAQYVDWLAQEPDAEALLSAAAISLSAARTARAESAAAIQVAGDDLDAHAQSRAAAEKSYAKVFEQAVQARTHLEVLENDGHDDASREKGLQELGLALLGARQDRDNALAALAVFPEDPRPAFERLERRRDAARDEREIASARHAETNARLEVKNASGPYEAFVLAEAEFCELRERLQETEREARAARLLRETLLGVEADREAGILAPVRKRTAELYGRVTAQAPGALHFNSDLTFSGMDVGGVRLLQTLSAGEREQLQMVARLALADLVTGEERQLVILDDTLRDTDARRFDRFLDLIQEFSRERMQFVINTCDKARYLGLDGADFIDFEALRRPLAIA